jgi:hypothetical protein
MNGGSYATTFLILPGSALAASSLPERDQRAVRRTYCFDRCQRFFQLIEARIPAHFHPLDRLAHFGRRLQHGGAQSQRGFVRSGFLKRDRMPHAQHHAAVRVRKRFGHHDQPVVRVDLVKRAVSGKHDAVLAHHIDAEDAAGAHIHFDMRHAEAARPPPLREVLRIGPRFEHQFAGRIEGALDDDAGQIGDGRGIIRCHLASP